MLDDSAVCSRDILTQLNLKISDISLVCGV